MLLFILIFFLLTVFVWVQIWMISTNDAVKAKMLIDKKDSEDIKNLFAGKSE